MLKNIVNTTSVGRRLVEGREVSSRQKSVRETVREELRLRAIYGVEQKEVKEVSIPAIPSAPAVIPEQKIEYQQAQRELLEELGLDEDTKLDTRRHKITFHEERIKDPKKGAIDYEEEMEIYIAVVGEGREKGESLEGVPIMLFLHGGTIKGPEQGGPVGGSGYLPVVAGFLEKQGGSAIIVAPNHRGSQDHLTKVDYCLDDRVTDGAVSLQYLIEQVLPNMEEVEWDGRVVIFGDSLGGAIAPLIANVVPGSELILVEPAAFDTQVYRVPYTNIANKGGIEGFGGVGRLTATGYRLHRLESGENELTQISRYKKRKDLSENEKGTEPDFKAVAKATQLTGAKKSPSIERAQTHVASGNEALVVEMTKDTVVSLPDEDGNLVSIPSLYVKAMKEANASNVQYVPVDAKHGETHHDEIVAIVNFIKG